jgi:predicted Fe-Mo cluster-binding NifX family protein
MPGLSGLQSKAMMYAITATGKSLDSLLDRRFGRCNYLISFNKENGSIEIIQNPFREEEENAGPELVEFLHKKKVQKVVSGSFGLRVKELMDVHRIQMIIPGEDVSIQSIINMLEGYRKDE